MGQWDFLGEVQEDKSTIRIVTRQSKPIRTRHKPSQKNANGFAFVANFAILCGFAAIVYSCSKMPAVKPESQMTAAEFAEKDHRMRAVLCAQQAIREKLLSPRSAVFPGLLDGVDVRDHARKMKDGTYNVTSYVDSQNGFGAMLRTWYFASIRLHQNDTFDVLYLQADE